VVEISHIFAAPITITMADINKDDLLLCNACICCFSALYTDFPALIGCSQKGECLCINQEACCKLNTKSYGVGIEFNKDGNICDLSLFCCVYALKIPTICCKGKNQCCCFVGQGSFPTDSDVPMMCSVLFIACYPKFGILKKVSEVK